ncbi:unnamed protein product [Linum tenue]|uniref:F-box domain-containing protein n=1 Tax=Linum tenue TaxID=586396 RepID=A0AAV0JXT3_9ROSI|nr:unnamed protein product [Linum tenue]
MEKFAGGNATTDNDRELGIAGKRHREEEGTTVPTDRLSILPEPILSNILSFLNTKSAVQTCVLSRSWRFTWKHIPVLNLRRDSFLEYCNFRRFVGKVLSFRYPHNARKISYTDDEGSEDRDRIRLIRAIEYAASHDTEHLVIELKDYAKENFRFSELFNSISNSTLKTLELGGVALDRGFESPSFRWVTTLDLNRCMLSHNKKWDADPFSKFPCLENLVLNDCLCISGQSLMVSGLNLISLKLIDMGFSKIEIFAPKLKSFSLWSDGTPAGFSTFDLPCLDHAYIQVFDPSMEGRKVLVEQHLTALFEGLRNAKSLALHSWTTQVLSDFDGFLEQPSPFTRLESLFLESKHLPHKVLNYFLKGPTVEPKVELLRM